MRGISSLALFTFALSSSCAARTVAQKTAAPQTSHRTSELTHASASRMTTSQLARLLMPEQPARRFISHEVGNLGPHGEPLSIVNFFYRPIPLGPDLCRRDVVSVSLQPSGVWQPGQDSPVKFSRASPGLQIAAAPRCRFKQGGYFAWVQPEEAHDGAAQALRRLLAIQSVAKTGARLPVRLDCQSEPETNACGKSAHSLIASLPLDRIFIVQPNENGWRFSVMPYGPGQHFWDVTLTREDAPEARMTLRWGMPAPF